MKPLYSGEQARRRGFTLTELAIVMGVMGVILSAIWWAAGNAGEAQRDNAGVTELQTVSQNILSLMQGQTFVTTACDSGGAFPCPITKGMIKAQAIPSTYIDTVTPTTADSPWSAKNFMVYAGAGGDSKIFRLSFFQVTQKGCLILLLQGTTCQVGQVGCPTKVWTNNPVGGGTTGSSAVPSATGTGWQTALGPTLANTMCAANNYAGAGNNSVEFDYSLN